MAQIVIIGKGPAGISAALYAARAGATVLCIGRDGGALEKAHKIENFYGHPQPISGKELLQRGFEQAQRLGVTLREDEVIDLAHGAALIVRTAKGEEFDAGAVILATGTARQAPKIPGIAEFEGKGVSYCAVCDAFFYRGRDVAVLGGGEYAMHEAKELQAVAASVTILTNGAPPQGAVPPGVRVIETPISALAGDDVLRRVQLQDDGEIEVAGAFIAIGTAGSVDLARKLGAEVEGSRVVVNEKMATNVPGLYAAGDCTGGLLQVAKAAYEGAVAGGEAARSLRA